MRCKLDHDCCKSKWEDDLRGPGSDTVSVSLRTSVFIYYAVVIICACMAVRCTFMPIKQRFFVGDDGKEYPKEAFKQFGGDVLRMAKYFYVPNSFTFTWCTPINNITFPESINEWPSILRYIEFYSFIGVYFKVPLVIGILYRSVIILAEEREAMVRGKMIPSLLPYLRVIVHLMETISIFLLIGLHQDQDREIATIHRLSLPMVIVFSSLHMSLTMFSLIMKRQHFKLTIVSLCLLTVILTCTPVLQSSYIFFLEKTCTLNVPLQLALAEYGLILSLTIFHLQLLPISIPSMEVALTLHDTQSNLISQSFHHVYQPVQPYYR